MVLDPYQRLRPTIDLLRRTIGDTATNALTEFARQALAKLPAKVKVSEVLFTKAHQHSAAGRFSEAVEMLDQILAREPENIDVLLTKGQILAAASRLDGSLAAFKKAESLAPDNAIVIESLARVQYALGDIEASLAYFRRLAEVKELDEETARMIGQSIWDLDEKRRGSSIFVDVEDGVQPAETTLAEVDALLAGTGGMEAKNVSEAVWLLARQLAAQKTVLGRLDAVYTVNEYTIVQGRFRSLALNRYRKLALEQPRDPVSVIPEDLRIAFSMGGRVELQQRYTNSVLPVECSDGLDDEALLTFLALNQHALPQAAQAKATRLLAGFSPIAHSQTSKAFSQSSAGPVIPEGLDVAGKSVALVGERDALREAALLCMCGELTSVRHRRSEDGLTMFKATTFDDWAKSQETYDVIVSAGTLEHAGLGRYGEQIDPDGDIALMRQFSGKLRPGGQAHVVVPIGRDRLIFNTLRIYGTHRLEALTAGWRHVAGNPVTTEQLSARIPKRIGLTLAPI